MQSTTETGALTRELSIAAPPEAVWAFLVDPAKMIRWMGESAVLEPEVGGAYRVDVVPGHVASGTVREIDPPRRLVVTWGWERSDGVEGTIAPGSSTVVFELEPSDAGTTLRFTHMDLPGREAAASHGEGWDHYLPRLASAASGTDPGRDPWLDRES